MQSVRRRNNHLAFKIFVGFLIVLALSFTAAIIWSGRSSAPTPKHFAKAAPSPKSISSNVLFTGNTFWGRYIDDWSMASPLKYAYPFSRLNEFHRDQYDAWISGLECPTVAGLKISSAEMDSTLTFNCNPDYLPEAAKWFTAFTLANNHTDNHGIDGFNETKRHLEENHIQYFGNPDPTVYNDICEVVGLPVTVTLSNTLTEKGKLPVAMCGYNAVFRIPDSEAVAQMQKYTKYMPVIAMPHMGAEYKPAPDEIKMDFLRSLVDGGADMVIGDHPHWIQPTESYKGHLIVYSMGNFIFDQQDTSEVVRSAGIRLQLKTDTTDSDLLQKWLALGDKCVQFKDDCLDQAASRNLTKLPINYVFSVVGTNDGGKIVKPATPDQQASILQRLNWSNTVRNLQAPYSGL